MCGAAFLAHLLSTGLQLAYGALHVYALRHLGPSADHAGKIKVIVYLHTGSYSIFHLSTVAVIYVIIVLYGAVL